MWKNSNCSNRQKRSVTCPLQAKRIDGDLCECYRVTPHESIPQVSKLIEQGMGAYTIGLMLFSLENLKADKVKRRAKVLEIYSMIKEAALEPAKVLPKACLGMAERARALKL